MTTPERPVGGRRDNGLVASSWAAVAEVDPRQVADLLAALAAAGIAAYTVPSPGLVGGYLEMRLPSRPVSRLHVDSARRQDAEALVRAELAQDPHGAATQSGAVQPGAGPGAAAGGTTVGRDHGTPLSAQDDAAFAAIVAGWDAPGAFVVAPWPVSEDTDADPAAPGAATVPPRVVSSYPVERERVAEDAAPQDEGHYVPPPPPPLPRVRMQTLLSILAIIAGAAVLIAVSVVGVGDQLPLFTGVLLIVTGIGGLLAGMREDDSDEGWDDGAVV